MDKTRILSGELLVNKGAHKANAALPEVGLKDVVPNGSWLEQKQIQAALEARKNLIELERIEKSGVLTHAEWREELMLAEVTQKVGGYWQYLGHNVGKQLFLNPEEALFLMEVNCLVLTYDEVKVSLQQAYALLLRSKISLMQYKVYASLSRLGYRVFRHQRSTESDIKEHRRKINSPCHSKKTDETITEDSENVNGSISEPILGNVKTGDKNSHIEVFTQNESDETTFKAVEGQTEIESHKDTKDLNQNVEPKQTGSGTSKKAEIKQNKFKCPKYLQHKINKLKKRKFKPSKSNVLQNCFGNIPGLLKNPIFCIEAPKSRYVPENVRLRHSVYSLSVERMRSKSTTSENMPSTSSSSNNSMNTAYQTNVNHLRHQSPNTYRSGNWTNFSSFNLRFSSQANAFRNLNFWRPQINLNYFHLNMTFQRPMFYPQFAPRVFLPPFSQTFVAPNLNERVDLNSNNYANRKKRNRDHLKKEHYDSIHRLASFVKSSILESRLSDENVSKLNHLIQTYNTRYKTRLRLSDDFTVISDENIIDSIEVDDDDEQTVKKPKKDDVETFNDKLERVKEMSHRLKYLEAKNEVTSRHRRMFSNLLKKFNDSYNVDYYINVNFDVIDRNDLTTHSSSDTERVAAKTAPKGTIRKKLKNPFFILKQLSDKQKEEENRTSTLANEEIPFNYSKMTLDIFKKDWLPEESDFGRAEIISREIANDVTDVRREDFLFDFIKIQPDKFKNWLDVKLSFYKCLQETCELFHFDQTQKLTGLQSLVKPDEFTDAASVLEKLRIIKNNQGANDDSKLAIDFDVYNRNVQNFKKSNRPLPHFRIICIKESSNMPLGADIASLHSKYKDDVTIVFAVVGTDSISYLQVNPTNLPVYVSSNNSTIF